MWFAPLIHASALQEHDGYDSYDMSEAKTIPGMISGIGIQIAAATAIIGPRAGIAAAVPIMPKVTKEELNVPRIKPFAALCGVGALSRLHE